MPGEAELVSEAKGYDGGRSAEAKRQVDSYFQNFRDRDTPANRGIVLRMSDPAIQADMQQLFDQADGKVVSMDESPPADVAIRPTAAEKGSGTVPEPTKAPIKGVSMADANAANYGTLPSPRQDALAATGETVNKDTDQRLVSADPGGDAPGGTVNASVQSEGPRRPYETIDPGTVMLHSSQSSNQGVIEPAEAKGLRNDAYGREQQSINDQEFYDRYSGQQQLEILNRRQAKLNELAKEDAAFQDRQNRIAAESERRIAAAEQALKEAEPDPNFNPMREIWDGNDMGKKILFMIGAFAGGQGAAISGGPNQFFEQFQKAVDRKVSLMEKRYQARKDRLGAAQDGYARMRQILQDQAATRAMIEARAWQMFDNELDKVMQQYSIDMADPRAQMLRATTARKQREAVMESARTTQHVTAMQEQQKDLKVVPLGGGEDKTGANIKAIVQAREAKKLPIIEGALDNVATGLSSMAKNSGARDTVAHWLKTGNGLGKDLAPYIAENKDAFARIAAAANDYVQSKAGSAQTEGEVARLAPVIGRGGTDALEAARRFYAILQNERRAKEADIQTMEGYDVFVGRKGLYSSNPKTQTYEPRVDPAGSDAVK